MKTFSYFLILLDTTFDTLVLHTFSKMISNYAIQAFSTKPVCVMEENINILFDYVYAR